MLNNIDVILLKEQSHRLDKEIEEIEKIVHSLLKGHSSGFLLKEQLCRFQLNNYITLVKEQSWELVK